MLKRYKIDLKLKWITLFTIILCNIASCTSENNCLIADQAEQIRVIQIEKNEYFVYLKISGWHDKVTFYELYGREPVFDQCGVSETHPISVMDVDPDQDNVSNLIINNSSKEMTIIYSKDDSQQEQQLKNVAIEIVKS